MTKTVARRRYTAGLLAIFTVASFLASAISIALPTEAAAYSYVDSSITSEEACKAQDGIWRSVAQGGSETGQYYTSCTLVSRPDQSSKLLLQAGWLASCLADMGDPTEFSPEDLQNYSIPSTSANKKIGHVIVHDDGSLNCGESGNIRSKVENIGNSSFDFLDLLIYLGCYSIDDGYYRCDDTSEGGLLASETATLGRIVSYVSTKTGRANIGSVLSDVDRYYVALETFKVGCQATRIDNPTTADTNAANSANGDMYYITEVTNDGSKVRVMYKADQSRGDDTNTAPTSLGWDDGSFSCGNLAGMINSDLYSNAYAGWVRAHPFLAVNVDSAVDNGNEVSSCAIEGIGWIICPVVNFLAMVADASFGFMADHFLKTNPAIFNNSGSTYDAWTIIRNVANIAFVIVFLVIIFSQLTSVGITNYGVKKMLPRLVIAAILVNVSYFISQIAVDISNILGYSIKGVFDSIAASAAPIQGTGQSATGEGFAGIAGGVLAIVGTAVIGYALLSTLIPVLLAAVVGLVMILFILVARQALIILLVVISPLAFVAFLLPNTEQWFKKWQKTLTALLLVFPMVALVFGASTLASTILSNAYSINGDTNNWFGQIIAAAVLVLPLFVVPSLLKKSIDSVGGIGAKLNGIGNKLSGAASKPLNKWAGEKRDLANNRYLAKPAGRFNVPKRILQSSQKRGELGKLKMSAYKAQQGADFSKDLRENADKYAGQMPDGSVAQSFIRGAASRAEAEALKSEMQPLTSEIAAAKAITPDFDLDGFLRTRAKSTAHSESQRAAAIHYAASLGRDNIMRELVNDPNAEIKRVAQEAVSANAGSLVNKAPDLVKPPFVAFDTVTGEDLTKFSAYTMGTYVQYLDNLHAVATSPSATQKQKEQLATATASFNSAVEDITKNPTLQGSFSSSNGTAIVTELANSKSPTFQSYANTNLHGLAAIQPDGKIR